MKENTELAPLQTLPATLKSMWPFVKPEVRYLLSGGVLVLLNSAFNVAIPFLVGRIIDLAIVGKNPTLLLWSLGGMLLLFIGALLTNLGQIWMMGIASQRILLRLRAEIFGHLQVLSLTYFQQHAAGDLTARITNDTDKLNQLFSESLVRFTGSGMVVIGIGIVMVVLQPTLALTALGIAAVLLVFTVLVSPMVQRLNSTSLTRVGDLANQLRDVLLNYKIVVSYNIRQFFKDQFTVVNNDAYSAAVRSGVANTFVIPLFDVAGNVAVLAVLGVGMWLLDQRVISIGLLITFLAYTDRFYQPLRILASIWANIQSSLAAWGRVNQVISEPAEIDGTLDSPQTADGTQPLIEFKDVSFGYSPEKTVLHKTNLSFEVGKTYALVGPTGGGKSTFASLVSRLYRPTKGEILFVGKSLNDYHRVSLSSAIGFILQEPVFFSGTLADNLRYGNAELANHSDDELKLHLQKQGYAAVIEKFPEGLQTSLSATQPLSLGQRQLAAFLRAVLRQPLLLILDEATANVDTITEQLLQRLLDKLPKNTTKIVIAHRLQTIREADQILFINQGEVQPALSFEAAVNMVTHARRKS